jgi:hypothetical protein
MFDKNDPFSPQKFVFIPVKIYQGNNMRDNKNPHCTDCTNTIVKNTTRPTVDYVSKIINRETSIKS